MTIRFASAILLVLAAGARAAAEPAVEGDEGEPYLRAATVVPAALLSGPDFRVVPEVRVRGYMADFVIDTTWGPLRAEGVEMLSLRVAEMPALAAIDRATRAGAFGGAAARSGRKTGAAVVNVLSHPVDTIAGLPAGVVRFLRAQVATWSRRAQALADQTARHAQNSGDPYRAPEGPMTAMRATAGDEDARAAQTKNHAWYSRAASETGREAKRYLKYARQRREVAAALGVDPATSNPILAERLDSLAWAAVAGNFSAGAAIGSVSGIAADVIGDSATLDQYVLQPETDQLRETLRVRLHAYCSDDESVRSFLRRGGFTDTLRIALVAEVERLRPASGCNDLVELASTTHGEVEARYLLNGLKLIDAHHPGPGRIEVIGAAIAWRAQDGSTLLPLPVDYLTWSLDFAEFVGQPGLAGRNRTVLISGDASMDAQRGFTARGWNLMLRAPFDGAPAYAAGDFRRPDASSACAARCLEAG
jgi:hypothetical protein